MTKTLSAVLIGLGLSLAPKAHAQTMDEGRLDAFAHAVARAEGFGVKGAIPTRYHNPGDIRTFRPGVHYLGQIGVARHGYVIFRNNSYGFLALKGILRGIVLGESRYYRDTMTVSSVARLYATGWRRWAKNVSKNLGITPNTKLREYLQVLDPVPEPPNYIIPDSKDAARSRLLAVVDIPVIMPARGY